jgi:guanosine-3',5'-bis(diphosphate) 3'-pyrophosphohydrolase
MNPTQTVEATLITVRKIFADKVDKGGKPYADHCLRVMGALPASATDDERMAALLHDVVEDTDLTLSDLLIFGWSERTVRLVEALTRFPGTGTYMDYVKRIAGSGDPGLIAIKLADNADNSDPVRVAALPAGEQGTVKRYARARQVLLDGLASLSASPAPAEGGGA